MPHARCHQCHKRAIWYDRNNDIRACKRCYHQVWQATRQRIRAYHTALHALQQGQKPALLASYRGTPQEIAAQLADALRAIPWSTGAQHEVSVLLMRCAQLTGDGSPRNHGPSGAG